MAEDPKTPEELGARTALGRARTEEDLLRAARGAGAWTDVAIFAAFAFAPLAARLAFGDPPRSTTVNEMVLPLLLVFHFRTRHRLDSLLEFAERRGLFKAR